MNEDTNQGLKLDGPMQLALAGLKLAPTTELGGSGEAPAFDVLADLKTKYAPDGSGAPEEAQAVQPVATEVAVADEAPQTILVVVAAPETAQAAEAPAPAPATPASPDKGQQGARGDRAERRGPMHQVARAHVRQGGQREEAHLPLIDLMTDTPDVLVKKTMEVLSEGLVPIFRFFVGGTGNSIRMSVAVIAGPSLSFTVVGGRGWLHQRFPNGTSFSLSDIKGLGASGCDDKHLLEIADFRLMLNAAVLGMFKSVNGQLELAREEIQRLRAPAQSPASKQA